MNFERYSSQIKSIEKKHKQYSNVNQGQRERIRLDLKKNKLQRNCITPSILKKYKKSNSKNSNKYLSEKRKTKKSSEKRASCQSFSGKNNEINKFYVQLKQNVSNNQKKINNCQSILKNSRNKRPKTQFENYRHCKNLQNNLQNLNVSLKRDLDQIEIKKYQKNKDMKRSYDQKKIETQKLFEEGKKQMDIGNYKEAVTFFNEGLKLFPQHGQLNYLIGLSYFHMQQNQLALHHFHLVQKSGSFSSNLYFFMALIYKKESEIQQSIEYVILHHQLSKIINRYSKNYDAFVFRGKMYLKKKKYELALKDFSQAVKINPRKSQAFVGMADSLRFLNKFSQAIVYYTQATKKQQQSENILLKRGITYMENKQYDLALKDIEQENKSNSQAYLFRGLIYQKKVNHNEAILSFEQAIKHNNSKKAVTKALYQIAKIKIELNDYYGAYYTLQRSNFLDVDNKTIEKLIKFTDATTLLMKGKYKEGIDILGTLIKKNQTNSFLFPLIYANRSYGYFCIGKHFHALNDLITLQQYGIKLDQPNQYNKYILQGNSIMELSYFRKQWMFVQFLGTLISIKYIFFNSNKAIALLISIGNENENSEQQQNCIKQAYKNLQKTIERDSQNFNAYFYKGILNFFMRNYKEAIKNFDQAIHKSDKDYSHQFYYRAILYGKIGQYQNAIKDLTQAISIQVEKQNSQYYLARAKCYSMEGDKNKAFKDLQKYILSNHQDQQIHFIAGNLLSSIGANSDAIKAYSHIKNFDSNSNFFQPVEIILERAKCFMIMKQLDLCLKDLNKYFEMSQDARAKFDYQCLQSLKIATDKSNENSFQQALLKLKEVKKLIDGNGLLFRRCDFYFYKAVYTFYLGDYKKAIKNFKKSLQIKNEEIEQNKRAKNKNDMQSEFNQFIFENKICTIYQIYYNIAIAYYKMDKNLEAQSYIKKIIKLLSQEHAYYFKIFLKILSDNQNNNLIDQQNITPFPTEQRLCSIFPQIQLKNKKALLSFCLPKVLAPSLLIDMDHQFLQKINISVVEDRPDAPWIKRNTFGVVFTQDIVSCQLDLNTPKNDEKKELQTDNLDQFFQNCKKKQSEHNSQQDESPIIPRERAKLQLALDPETQAKLKRLNKK